MVIGMNCAAVSLFLLPAALMAQEANSSSAYAQGVGRLELTFLDNAIAVALQAPGQDIVGFGHPAETEEDRAHVAEAISDLSNPLTLFDLPAEAGCMTASANVVLAGDAFGQEQEVGTEAAHTNAFHADYVLQCEDISAIQTLRLAYFDRFGAAQELVVQLSSAAGTRDVLVRRETPDLTLP